MLCLPQNLHFEVHKVLYLPQNLHFEVHQVLRLPRNLHLLETKSAHRGSQSAAPATKYTFRSKAAPIPCACHEKSTLEHQSTRFPWRLPRKVTTMCENAHGATTRGQSRHTHAPATQTLRACAGEMHLEDVERHECTVNSSGLAAHARTAQRSKHSCISLTVRTPSVSTLFGEFNTYIFL